MTLNIRTRYWLFWLLIVVGVLLLGWIVGVGEFAARQMSAWALLSRDYDAAGRWAKRAAWLNSQDPETEFLLARIARKRGLMAEMTHHLDRAGVLGLADERHRREEVLATAQTGGLDGVIDELPTLLLQQQGDGAEICEAFANGLLRHGRIDEAKVLIQQWQVAYPNDPAPDVMLARLSEFDLQTKVAEQHYRSAIRKNAEYFPAQYGLGRTLTTLNQWLPAYEAFQCCLAMPVKAPAQFGMARCLVHLDRNEEARTLLLAAAAEPQESFLQALKQLGESAEYDNLSLELGILEAKLGHLDDALRWLKRAVDYNSKHRQARYQLALTLNSAGRTEEAKAHFEWYVAMEKKIEERDRLHDLVKRNPRDLDTRCRLGALYLETDSNETGLFWLHGVLADAPMHRDTHEILANYYEAQSADPSAREISQYHRKMARQEVR